MRYVRAQFLGSNDQVAKRSVPDDEATAFVGDDGRELVVKVFAQPSGRYLSTVLVKFPERDSVVEMQYDAGQTRNVHALVQTFAKQIGEDTQERGYIIGLAERYLPASIHAE